MSENATLDGREVSLTEALRETVGSGMGTLLSCIPGRLGYYEGEEPNERTSWSGFLESGPGQQLRLAWKMH